ncbi:MAG TPA: RNA polymerase sigma factor [Spirochaetota bacterium]|nr:RNA polymerase sigma factor [Spirochaetota bacterium]HPI91125.1 RNA polymerase sigma factor [Spirochaetota bacterium]HPR49983.1 RNA polymerase sigma factor [Spirochaetota bacterium]
MSGIPLQNQAAEEDRKLLDSFSRGNEKAFDDLVKKYRDLIFNLCYRYLGDYDEADECAQEVFIKMYHGIAGFRMESALSTWLYRVAVNACKNRISAKKTRRKYVAEPARDSGNPGLDTRGDSSFDPAGVFENNERQMLIRKAIETLPPAERLMIILKDMEGRTYGEIEEITGIKEGTVKSTLARTRKKMRILLKDIFP